VGTGGSSESPTVRLREPDVPAFRLSAHRAEERIWVERGQRLRSLVTDTEWESLERSRLNAFFTSPDVVEAIWNGLLTLGLGDLTNPRILEPAAGVGRFLGLQPADTPARACRTAVELDALTARILKALYPRATVHNLGFQDAPIRDEFFDVAISNVPFGDIPVVDRAFLKPGQRYLTRAIHNYFFVKALTKVRPGGVLAFITSRYTLDAPTAEPIRAYLHQQADLVAAIRLPAGTFPDTDVVTDCIILRKRLPAEPAGDDVWLRTVLQTYAYQCSPSGRSTPHLEDVHSDLNAYFVAHPQMVLGLHATTSVMYGGGGYTVAMPHGGRAAVRASCRSLAQRLPSRPRCRCSVSTRPACVARIVISQLIIIAHMLVMESTTSVSSLGLSWRRPANERPSSCSSPAPKTTPGNAPLKCKVAGSAIANATLITPKARKKSTDAPNQLLHRKPRMSSPPFVTPSLLFALSASLTRWLAERVGARP
jgi:N-6 DNA methylase